MQFTQVSPVAFDYYPVADYWVTLKLDPNMEVDELSEDNNNASFTFKCTGSKLMPAPFDVFFNRVAYVGKVGETVSVKSSIVNLGEITRALSQGVHVLYGKSVNGQATSYSLVVCQDSSVSRPDLVSSLSASSN